MALRVEILSRETIKPSSPTPQSLRTYNLSLLDQVAPSVYVPILLFYSPTIESDRRFDILKKSLSETLTHMYPLAGRVKDQFSIECNDEGADFIRTRVFEDMSTVLQHPKIDILGQLLPCDFGCDPNVASNARVILAIQVNHFGCGGMAIGMCILHVIADASSCCTFLKNWAAMAVGGNVSDGLILDCTSFFPPTDLNGYSLSPLNRETVIKRFVFDANKIVALREKATIAVTDADADGTTCRPTRIETVSTFIWAAVIAAARERSESKYKMHLLTHAVDLRKRMDPPLSPHIIGNIFHMTALQWAETEKVIDYKVLVERVRESIQVVKDEYVRKIYANGNYFNEIKQAVEVMTKSEEVGSFIISSWCRFPFYEVDFGWGKPIWVGNAWRSMNMAIFMDTNDGEGIEAWVGLQEEDMDRVCHNPDFLAYVSSEQKL